MSIAIEILKSRRKGCTKEEKKTSDFISIGPTTPVEQLARLGLVLSTNIIRFEKFSDKVRKF
jgi:hypothetical protein